MESTRPCAGWPSRSIPKATRSSCTSSRGDERGFDAVQLGLIREPREPHSLLPAEPTATGRCRSRPMYQHHRESAARAAAHFAADPDVRALILAGSVAHGFATEDSDLDLLIVVSDAEYAQRRRDGSLQFLDSDLCTYPNGYVDGKYLGESLVRGIAERGSEPARFAFKDAEVLFSRIDDLEALVSAIPRYPVDG